jgi:outer membrane protein assembly factor BamA
VSVRVEVEKSNSVGRPQKVALNVLIVDTSSLYSLSYVLVDISQSVDVCVKVFITVTRLSKGPKSKSLGSEAFSF